jgi:hypothetical protein
MPGRALPAACRWPPVNPPPPADADYGIGRIDASGRVGDHAVTGALGWRKGDRLTLTADAGVVVARRDPGGMVTVPARAYIAIPAALRRRCGLHAGDLVLQRSLASAAGGGDRYTWLLASSCRAAREAWPVHVGPPPVA